MISLLLTLFISMFSYCPSVDKIEEHEENVIIQDDNIPIKSSYNVSDSQGNVTYFTDIDLKNGDFIRTFISSIPSVLRMGFYEYTLNDYVFTGLGGSVWQTVDGHQGAGQFSVNQLTIHKTTITDYTYQNLDYTLQIYNFKFEYIRPSDSRYFNVFELDYSFSVPYITTNDGDIGIQCIGVSYTNHQLSNNSFLYIENDKNGGYNPFYLFGYVPYNQITVDTNAYQLGFNTGYNSGITEGVNLGYDEGERVGYQNGYAEGYSEAASIDDTASTIFTGILDVGLIPVNVFLTIFNFEVFGINIGGIVSGLLTLSVVIIILRFLFGGKKDD